MEVLGIAIIVISLVVASVIVNAVQQMFMKFMGANVMFFDGKKKLLAIIVIALILTGLLVSFFGLA